MKKALTFVLILTLMFALAACSEEVPCDHQWGDALCTEKPVCTLCGAEAETVKGHTWQAATMDAPKTCTVCKITMGDPLSLEGTWKGVAQFFPLYFGVETPENRIIEAKMTLVLDEDGIMELTLEYDKENYDAGMTEILTESIYLAGEARGETREQTDDMYMTQCDMTVAEYAAQQAAAGVPADYKEVYTFTYTLEGQKLLYGDSLDKLDRYYRFSLDGDDLVLRDEIADMVYDLTKVS